MGESESCGIYMLIIYSVITLLEALLIEERGQNRKEHSEKHEREIVKRPQEKSVPIIYLI